MESLHQLVQPSPSHRRSSRLPGQVSRIRPRNPSIVRANNAKGSDAARVPQASGRAVQTTGVRQGLPEDLSGV